MEGEWTMTEQTPSSKAANHGIKTKVKRLLTREVNRIYDEAFATNTLTDAQLEKLQAIVKTLNLVNKKEIVPDKDKSKGREALLEKKESEALIEIVKKASVK